MATGNTLKHTSVLALLLVPVLAACGTPGSAPAQAQPPETSAPDKPPAELQRFYDQKLAFGPCAEYAITATEKKAFVGDSFQCARLKVPLDYDAPEGETAQLAVLRMPARGKKIGSLVTNPGGPGGAGLLSAVAMSLTLKKSPTTERFDLIGFDPRGVGASTPAIKCFTDAEQDRADNQTTLIGSAGQWTERDTRQLVDKCADASGGKDSLAAVGTRDVARDLDVLRAALGDDKLTYAGQSYGTRLGAVYAEMFPANVRAMVFDGAVDPKLGTVERRKTQYAGFQRAFEKMAAACAADPGCPLGKDPAKATKVFQDLMRPLIDKPVPAGKGRELTYNQGTAGVISGLYVSAQWPAIIKGIAEVKQGRGETLLALAEGFAGRDETGKWNNFGPANYAINCMDEQRRTPEREADLRAQLNKAAPFLDPGQGVKGTRDGCEHWPAKPTMDYPYADQIKGLPKTLTVSITGDPSTPYDGGVSLAKSLGGSLLTVDGEQHTVVQGGTSPCVNDIVADYLVNLKTPADGARCKLK
ncbi:alpha/beta hydrolase [Nonomuraea sp. NPDC050404]|uniref:alpha/beta hydrolase n=1 Tax=Nonomuraea sp. NPDC050404 TaxID=3155783 RepID=UPI0033D749FB